MAVKTFKPTTPSRRNMSVPSFEEITKSTPEKSLVVTKKKHAGRNNTLYVTVGVQLQGKKKRLLIIRSSVDIMEIIVFSNCEFKITAGE